MGWNCPDCGRLLTPRREENTANRDGPAHLGYGIQVDLCFCSNCAAQYVTVFKQGSPPRGGYCGLVKVEIP